MTVNVAHHLKAAARCLPEVRLLIGDSWLDRGGGGSFDHVNPATGDVQAAVPMADARDVDAAVRAAEEALGVWRGTSVYRRAELLVALGNRIRESKADLSALLSIETGLPIGIASVFCDRGSEFLEYYAGVGQTIQGDVIDVGKPNCLDYVLREPYGVVALIMTWNGGLSALGRKAGAALMAGNTVVIKPSELAPFSGTRFAEYALEVGFPPGVINVILGDGAVGEHLVTSGGVRKVSFTGGLAVARKIQAAAGAPKPVALELGGKTANIVFPDADLDRAARTAAAGALYMSGQGCALPTRLLIHASVYDQVLDGVLKATSEMVLGDPLEPTTVMGPIVSEAHRDRILAMIARARDAGAGELCTGGSAADVERGFFIQPTVFSHVDPNSEIAREEVFGPVLSVFPFDDDEEALALANGTQYGLATSIHTSSLGRAHSFVRRVESGSVSVNSATGPSRGSIAVPFGGIKGSGFGREGGLAGLDEFMTMKNVSISLE